LSENKVFWVVTTRHIATERAEAPTLDQERDRPSAVGVQVRLKNPLKETTPYRGLLVILVMFNSADLKDNNNSIYERLLPDGKLQRWFVVRDLGTSLGATTLARRAGDGVRAAGRRLRAPLTRRKPTQPDPAAPLGTVYRCEHRAH
jgi:hypothetical protein